MTGRRKRDANGMAKVDECDERSSRRRLPPGERRQIQAVRVRGQAIRLAERVLWRDRGFAPAHVLSGLVGLELPTASDLARAEQLASDDAQPGSRSWDPTAGLAYAFFGGAFSLQSAATPLPTRPLTPVEGDALLTIARLHPEGALAQEVIDAEDAVRSVADAEGAVRGEGGSRPYADFYTPFAAPPEAPRRRKQRAGSTHPRGGRRAAAHACSAAVGQRRAGNCR